MRLNATFTFCKHDDYEILSTLWTIHKRGICDRKTHSAIMPSVRTIQIAVKNKHSFWQRIIRKSDRH